MTPRPKTAKKTERRKSRPRTLGGLRAAEWNPREIDEGAAVGLGVSLEEFGDIGGITFNVRSGELVAGHQRVERLKAKYGEGLKIERLDEERGVIRAGDGGEWVVRFVDWPRTKHVAANVAANSGAIAGTFTDDVGLLLGEVQEAEPDLYERLLLDRFDTAGDQREIIEDEIPEPPQKPVTKPGDLWLLGEHRLLCGDSTVAEDVARVMGGENADCVLTDPPYGIAWNGDYTRFTKKGLNQYDKIHGDEKPFDPAPLLAFDNIVLWGANFYAALLPVGSWLIWDKRSNDGTSFLADAELAWQKGGKGCYIKSINQQGEVSKLRDIAHPTKKPVALFAWCIERLGEGIVFDPYLGSGTTLVAAEQLGRRCFGMEISPQYCDVIVRRWENLTGGKGKRVRG